MSLPCGFGRSGGVIKATKMWFRNYFFMFLTAVHSLIEWILTLLLKLLLYFCNTGTYLLQDCPVALLKPFCHKPMLIDFLWYKVNGVKLGNNELGCNEGKIQLFDPN